MDSPYEAKTSDLFKSVGENLVDAYKEAQAVEQKAMRIQGLTFSIDFVLSPDLKKIRLPSNQDLRLDRLKTQSMITLKVTAR